MKKILSLFLLVAQQICATNHTVAITGGDNRSNITDAIIGLTDFDTLTFPACSIYVAHPTITITIKIKILGVDTSNTILFRSSSSSDANLLNVPFFTFNGSSWSMAPSGVQVKGIKFKSKEPSVDDAGADGKSVALDQALKFNYVSGFEVTNCAFWWFGNGANYINHRDYFARGLIHHCGFVWNAKGATGLGYGYGVAIYGENLQWMTYANHSDGNMIYIEDCVFRFQSHAIASGGCGKYESRYNVIRENIISANASKHGIDGHGQQGDKGALGSQNYFSTRIMISYYDTLINTLFFDRTTLVSNGTQSVDKPMERAVLGRGCPMIVHNDYVSGYRFAYTIGRDGGVFSYPYPFGFGCASSLTYPSTHAGLTVSQIEDDAHLWSNGYSVFDGSDGDGASFYNYYTSVWSTLRDYHQSDNSSAAKTNYADLIYPCIYHY